MTLPEFGVKRPVATLMVFVALALLAVVATGQLPVDLFPEIEPPVISVITYYPGASAEDVESKVTRHIENELSIVGNLDRIRSTSRENLSIVTCRFTWGTNLDEASNDIRDRLEFAGPRLPEDADNPFIFKFNTAMFPVLVCGVSAGEHWENLHHIVENEIADPLKRVPGVGAVSVFGGLRRQINVILDRARLDAYGVTPEQIESVLRSENMTIPAGSLKMGRSEHTLRVPAEFQTAREVGSVVIKRLNGRLVQLDDVAKVEDSFREQTVKVVADGAPAVVFYVQKQAGANTVRVVERVQEALLKISATLPADVHIAELQNEADFIRWSISNLRNSAILGGVLVVLVTITFLRRGASSFIIAVTIPVSMVSALLVMRIFDYSLNTMSLFAVAMASGMVVDNAMVILENITRHREMGHEAPDAAVLGASQVGLAITASTLTTVVIFVPLLFLTGIIGVIFGQLAVVFSAALVSSLLVSLTLTPMLASRCLRQRLYRPATRAGRALFAAGERVLKALELAYGSLITSALDRRRLVILLAVLSMGVAFLAAQQLGSEFFPEEDVGNIRITVELPVETRLEESDLFARRLYELVREVGGEDIVHLFYRAGATEEGLASVMGGREGSNVVEMTARLTRHHMRIRDTGQIAADIERRIRAMSGVVNMQVDPGNPLAQMIFAGERPISVQVIGHDLEATDAVAERIRAIMTEIPGTTGVVVSRSPGKGELIVDIDRSKASALGVNVAAAGTTLRTFFYGRGAGHLRQAGDEYDIFMRLAEEQRSDVADISAVTVGNFYGDQVPLASFATIKEAQGPAEIERLNQQRLVTVGCATHGRSQGEVAADLRSRMAGMALPAGVDVRIAGMVEEQEESFAGLIMMLAIGVALVYMVMAGQFESLLHPFVIMFSVPFAFVGAALALFLFGYTLSVLSFIGIIMLVGIVVNNAIVLVDYTNTLRRQGDAVRPGPSAQRLPAALRARGMELTEAVKLACRRRLRPVLMTTLTTVFGMLPLAMATGEGSEAMRPIGTTVIGGLIVSTLVTLVLVPVVYVILEKGRLKQA